MMIHFTCNTYIYTNLCNCSLHNVLTIFLAKRWLNELQALFRFCRKVRTALFVQDAVSCLPRLEGANRRIRSNFDGDSKQISPAISTSSSSSFSSSSSPSSSNETSTETLVPQKFGCFGWCHVAKAMKGMRRNNSWKWRILGCMWYWENFIHSKSFHRFA